MPEAAAYPCAVCGAPTDPERASSGYCRSPVATLRCARCFKLNVPEALHCSGCGVELGLEPVETPSKLRCPDCRVTFKAFGAGAEQLRECPGCRGQFVDHSMLQALLERRRVYQGVHLPLPPRQNPLANPVRYLRCPACDSAMNRNNFGDTSGIIVDVCAQHGVWFGPGELPSVLAFARAGGLERARRRRREAGRARAAETPLVLIPGEFVAGSGSLGWLDPLADAGLALLDAVIEAAARLRE
jgi:Zn-finger nucleic acid-binding protein